MTSNLRKKSIIKFTTRTLHNKNPRHLLLQSLAVMKFSKRILKGFSSSHLRLKSAIKCTTRLKNIRYRSHLCHWDLSATLQLRETSCARAGGPDDLPNWVLREFANILAAPLADILNPSFSECKIPRAWKIADVSPLPKAPTVNDINKDLRPISLTSMLSKVAESFVIDEDLYCYRPSILPSLDSSRGHAPHLL